MITQELKIHNEPTIYNHKQDKSNMYSDYGQYCGGWKVFTKHEIDDEIKQMNKAGIKVGQRFRHKNSNSNYHITIMGVDNDPRATYYQNTPQVVLAKGNAKGGVEIGYTVKEILEMEKLENVC